MAGCIPVIDAKQYPIDYVAHTYDLAGMWNYRHCAAGVAD
jgi:hypothetical protein